MMQIIWGIEEHAITRSFLCTDKPRITLEPSPLNIFLGSSKQLRCIVSANPKVSRVRWQKDTQTLTSKKDFFFTFSFSEIPGKYISFVKFYNIITCGIFFSFTDLVLFSLYIYRLMRKLICFASHSIMQLSIIQCCKNCIFTQCFTYLVNCSVKILQKLPMIFIK